MEDDFFPETPATASDQAFQHDMIAGLQLDEETIHSVLQQDQ